MVGRSLVNPLRIPVRVEDEALPVLAFFASHGIDVGSVNANRIDPAAPPDLRLLCTAHATEADVWDMAREMRVAFHNDATLIELTSRVAMVVTAMDTRVVVFLDIAAVGVVLNGG